MEKIKELIKKYINKHITSKNFISHLKKYYHNKELSYDELIEIYTYLKSISSNKIKVNKIIDMFIIQYIEENICEMDYNKVNDILNDLDVELSRYLMIKLIYKNIINKDNLDIVSSKYSDALNYYKVLKEDFNIDYKSILSQHPDYYVCTDLGLKPLEDHIELKMLIDYKIHKNQDALTCLLIHNYGLIHKCLNEKKYISNLDYDYYFNSGLMGLKYSIDKYDLYSGVKLSTYATPSINLYINRSHSSDKLISLPQDIIECPKSIKRLSEEDQIKFNNANSVILSLDKTIDDSDDSSDLYNFIDYNDFSIDEINYLKTSGIEDEVINNYTTNQIIDYIKNILNDREYKAFIGRNVEKMKLREVVKEYKFNVSSESVRQYANKGAKKLKNPVLRNMLLDSLEITDKDVFKVDNEVSMEDENMVEKIEEKRTKELYEEPRIDDFDERENARSSLLRKFCGFYKIDYNVDGEYKTIYEFNIKNFNRTIYNKIGKHSFVTSLVNGYSFITVEDIDEELRKKDRKMSKLDSPLHAYMEIDDIFYLKIADKIREENGKDLTTLSCVTSYVNSNIYSHVRFLANHYYGRAATTEEIENLLESVFLTFDGSIPMTTHLKNIVKDEIVNKDKIKRLS